MWFHRGLDLDLSGLPGEIPENGRGKSRGGGGGDGGPAIIIHDSMRSDQKKIDLIYGRRIGRYHWYVERPMPFQRLLGLQPDRPHPSASSPFWPHFYGALRSACWSFRCSGRYGSFHLPPPFPTWSSARRLRWFQARLLRLAQASIRRTLHFLVHDSICRHLFPAPGPADANAPGAAMHALPPAPLPPIFHTFGLSPPGVPQPPFPSFIAHLSTYFPGIASLLVPSTAPRPLPGVHTPHVYSFSPHVFSTSWAILGEFSHLAICVGASLGLRRCAW